MKYILVIIVTELIFGQPVPVLEVGPYLNETMCRNDGWVYVKRLAEDALANERRRRIEFRCDAVPGSNVKGRDE